MNVAMYYISLDRCYESEMETSKHSTEYRGQIQFSCSPGLLYTLRSWICSIYISSGLFLDKELEQCWAQQWLSAVDNNFLNLATNALVLWCGTLLIVVLVTPKGCEIGAKEAAQRRSCGCPSPGDAQGRAGWSCGQTKLVGGSPAHGMSGAGSTLRTFPTPNILWFCDSMVPQFCDSMIRFTILPVQL